jgi:hypothetical protein
MVIRYERECENPDESTVGQMIWRSNASGAQVHGQFGTTPGAPWPAQPGSVTYTNIELSQAGPVTLTLRYSKYSSSSVPIQVYLDDEPTPRAAFTPVDQGDWNSFTWSEAIALGEIESGVHALRLATDGQQYGVVDLDTFVLELRSPVVTAEPAAASIPVSAASAGDLVTWYDFEGDYLQSGVVTDRSGNGWDAQVVGNIGAVDGISAGQGMVFTGDGYLQAQGNPAAGRTSVTFSLWFKTDQPEANYKLASAAWWNGGPGSGWIMATHIPEFWSDDTLGLYLPGISNKDNNFPAGEWIHEAVTYDGTRIKEYTNGQLVNDWPTTGALIGQGLPMTVGAWPSFQGFNFQGSIDEFQIFAAALTPQQVLKIYNEGQ